MHMAVLQVQYLPHRIPRPASCILDDSEQHRLQIMTTKRPTYCLFLAMVFIGITACASVAAQPPRPLFVLLTNDDGVDAPGLAAMRSGLEEAGHRVLTVAPSVNRSGSSGALSVRGPLPVARVSESVYSVAGTPVDSVRVGVLAIAQRPPDLVVSGINEGHNVGPAILMSGTVGAALSAQTLAYRPSP